MRNQQKEVDRWNLNRLYGDWPALDISVKKKYWIQTSQSGEASLIFLLQPLGVASMAQVHVLTREFDGKEFVVKVLKPNSVERLKQTVCY